VVPRNTAYVSRLLLKSSDLSIVPFYGQFVGVIKAVEPPPQQNLILFRFNLAYF
jgi:hypothetical protein